MPKLKQRNLRDIMDDQDCLNGEVTVVDVYDIASEIGKECEKIIDQFGADAVTSLMPRVINALELLETLATKNELENNEVSELRARISQLENDKIEKAEYRKKFEKELEFIEEQWRSETKELLSLVSKLQEENRRLVKVNDCTNQGEVPSHDGVNCDGVMLQKLKASLEKQRDELKSKEKLLQDKCCDIEVLKSQVDRLTNSSKELRRRHKSLQMQVRTLCDERADFLVQLQDQQRDIVALRKRLGLAQKENEDLAKCDVIYPSNKAVFDLDDPNRPRFTTQELKDILHERNELKARVSDLEDELETYRPKDKVETFNKRNIFMLPVNVSKTKRNDVNVESKTKPDVICDTYHYPTDEDAPVQGPLPCEPDDAPWKKTSESGIRKFFRKIFSESGTGSSFPRRSLSTLSKMALSATNEPIPI